MGLGWSREREEWMGRNVKFFHFLLLVIMCSSVTVTLKPRDWTTKPLRSRDGSQKLEIEKAQMMRSKEITGK